MSTDDANARQDGESRYNNPETKDRLDEHREQMFAEQRAEQVEQARSNQTARKQIAQEEQPDPEDASIDLRETYAVEFRDYEFEFAELGDAQIKAAQFEQRGDEVEAGTEAAEFVYETLGEKCIAGPDNLRGDPTTEEWWRQFGTQAVMQAFKAIVEEEVDVDQDVREEIDNFPDE